jgi:PEP-CTERM motif
MAVRASSSDVGEDRGFQYTERVLIPGDEPMKRFLRAVGAVVLLLAVPNLAEAGPITYAIQNYPADQNGATVSGTFTSDGKIGDLSKTDITSWTLTITPSWGTAVSVSSSSLDASLAITGDVVASAFSITLAAPTVNPSDNILQLHGRTDGFLVGIDYVRGLNGSGPSAIYDGTDDGFVWQNGDPSMGGTDPWVIAQAVPEPSSVILAALGALGIIGWRLARRCMAVRPA